MDALTDDALRDLVAELLRFDTTDGNEAPANEFLRERLADLGFETYTWTADAAALADHPSFPDDPAEIDVADRPSVAGVVEFGDPGAGPTLVLNGHVDVVPADATAWSSPPFEPTWSEDGTELTARGAADMKSQVGACVAAASRLGAAVNGADDGPAAGDPDAPPAAALDGRLVVESVAGEEEGGVGAAAAALENPYPFERDAAVVIEPTELRVVTATEGTVMKRLVLEGRSAHAATRWRGESVLPHFRRVREAFRELERQRAEVVTHSLYGDVENPWPVTFGRVEAGSWASNVPGHLEARMRLGVAPGESVDDVEAAYEARLREVVEASEWLSAHPPTFERFSVQFEPAEVDVDDPVVGALGGAMSAAGLDPAPTGATYGADSRHYQAVGIPTVVFGPGSIEQAHYPDETMPWGEVETAVEVLAGTARRFLAGG
jgi:acetylornithine deacetylase